MTRQQGSITVGKSRRSGQATTIAWATLITIAIGFAWRIGRYALGFPIWGDEAFIVTSLYSRGFADMFKPLECGQVAPLVFMWAELGIAKFVGMSEWALRLPAFLSGLLAMAIFVRFAKRGLDRRSALLAIAIFAASYYIVRHATEVKPYAWDLCVSMIITSLAWSVYTHPGNLVRWAALAATCAAGVWMSYPAVFVGGAACGVLALRLWGQSERRWRIRIAWLCLAVAMGASFLTMYANYGSKQASDTSYMLEIKTWKNDFPPMNKPWLIPWWWLKLHTGNMTAYPVGGKNFASTGSFILVVLGSWSLWRSRRRALLALLLGPLPLIFIAAALRKYPYGSSTRISHYMAPAFCLLAGTGLWWATRKVHRIRQRQKVALLIAAGVIVAIAVGGLGIDIVRPHKKFSDMANRDVMRDLAAKTRKGDQWIIFQSLTPDGSTQYIHNIGGSGARFRYYVRRNAPVGVAVRWAPKPGDIPTVAGRTWLIVYHDNKVPIPQAKLDAYLAATDARLGKGQLQENKLSSGKDPDHSKIKLTEAIDVYEYAPRPTSQPTSQISR